MSLLKRQQQALIDALFEWPSGPAELRLQNHILDAGGRGLRVYQSNGHALAQRALEAAYPVLQQMLGDESFADLARAFWHADPPHCGDAARWGEGLAAFVAGSNQLSDDPYLSDVARAEWALHLSAIAADSGSDTHSFALLTTEEPSSLRLILSAGTCVLQSQWPLAALILAHSGSEISLAEAAAQLRAGQAQDVVIWRAGLQPRLRQAQSGEFGFLHAVLQGTDFGAALDNTPEFDFSVWLIPAVQSGLLVRVERNT